MIRIHYEVSEDTTRAKYRSVYIFSLWYNPLSKVAGNSFMRLVNPFKTRPVNKPLLGRRTFGTIETASIVRSRGEVIPIGPQILRSGKDVRYPFFTNYKKFTLGTKLVKVPPTLSFLMFSSQTWS